MYEIAGFLGVAFYLGSYAVLQLGLISGRGYLYAGLNLVGASLLLFSLFKEWNLFSAIIQISWIALSTIGIARVYFLNSVTRFTEAEQAIVDTVMPQLSKLDARAVLKLGYWTEAAPGLELTEEGAPVVNLAWVHEGAVGVEVSVLNVS